jgi:ABC-2 type transport system permease protein
MSRTRILAVARRILRQLARDRRTLVLILVAPLAVLWLLKLVLASGSQPPRIAAVDLPTPLVAELEKSGAHIRRASLAEAEAALAANEVDAILRLADGKLHVKVEGSDPPTTGATLQALQTAATALAPGRAPPRPDIEFLHGSEELTLFDNLGPVLLGFFVFLFTFMVSGMSFVRERTSGTLERMLVLPLRRHELVFGYLLGFASVAVVQATLITTVAVTLLEMRLVGSFVWLLVVVLLLALTALSLGMLLSAFARNEFQMFQLVPLVVVPQVFFSGLLPLGSMAAPLRALGYVLPLTYGAHAIREVMLRGGRLADIALDLAVLVAFVSAFVALNIVALRKCRRL